MNVDPHSKQIHKNEEGVKKVADLLFKEEREKGQDNGSNNMLIHHNNQSADTTGS